MHLEMEKWSCAQESVLLTMNYRCFVLVYILLAVALLSGCLSLNSLKRDELNAISVKEPEKINGFYGNTSIAQISDSSFLETLWGQTITYRYKERGGWKNHIVKLECLSQRRLKLTLIDSGKVVREKTIRGNIKHGYFYKKRHLIVYPIVPLCFGYNTYRYRLGLSEGDLIVDRVFSYWGFFLVAGGSGKGLVTTRHHKQ